MKDMVMQNNSQVKKMELEDPRRNFKFSNNYTSVTMYNDNLNIKTSNVNFVCVTYGKCVFNDNHDDYVLHFINDMNSRTKKPIAVPISTREPKRIVNQTITTTHKRTVSSESTIQKAQSRLRKLYENVNLEVAFRKSSCHIRDLKGNDLLTVSRGIDLYTITLQKTTSPNPICLMAKASSSQAWLWHQRLSHLNFDTINLLLKNNIVIGLSKLKFVKDHLCSSYELRKAKRVSYTWTYVVPCGYEYIKNHKKIVKNKQARTREQKSEQKEAKESKAESKAMKKSSLSQTVKGKSNHGQQKSTIKRQNP
ncbi:retrovirus-related pol polyprotein from transposon TNT 1-94 [Tanacetum coccineum]